MPFVFSTNLNTRCQHRGPLKERGIDHDQLGIHTDSQWLIEIKGDINRHLEGE